MAALADLGAADAAAPLFVRDGVAPRRADATALSATGAEAAARRVVPRA
ncbi:MAG: hypothetical protein AVDCRST_MAG11-995, partial [uncultured Gemmatimonadaceae bacterium]